MKRKKFWITFLSVVGSLFVILLGTYLLTKLSTVSVEFRSRLEEDETRLEIGVLDRVKTSGEFDYSNSVLFTDVSQNRSKIEKCNPYIKVEQIIRKFPNKICVYVSERIPKYRIKETETSNRWYILDEDFKVLETLTTAEIESKQFNTNTVELKFISQKTYVGDFINNNSAKERANEIMSGVYGKTRDYFAAISIDYDADEDTFLVTMKSGDISYDSGCILTLVGSQNLKNKAFAATSVYVGTDNALEGIDLSKKVIIISDANKCIVKNQEE